MYQKIQKTNTVHEAKKYIEYLEKQHILLITTVSNEPVSKSSVKVNTKFKTSVLNFLEHLDENNKLSFIPTSRSNRGSVPPGPNSDNIEFLRDMGILVYNEYEPNENIHNAITITEAFINDVANLIHFTISDHNKYGSSYHPLNPNFLTGLSCVLSTAFFINMLEECELDLETLEKLIALTIYFMKLNKDWDNLIDYTKDLIRTYYYEGDED